MNSISPIRAVINPLLRPLVRRARRLVFRGTERYCGLCDSSLRGFYPYGVASRSDARCPACGSLERHRLLKIVAEQKTDLFDGEPKRILHIAPEEAIERLVRQLPRVTYLSADIEDPRASVRMDITNIEYPGSSFDVILCNHVLEHVPDDRKALREFHRVLSPGGLGMIQVPVSDPVTFEDFTITDPEERRRIFGQPDHVRRYGPDIRDRMEEAGFAVEEITTEDVTSEGEALRMGLMKGDQVFVCRKRMSSAS
jgi:SAM-dependent methyltransferase